MEEQEWGRKKRQKERKKKVRRQIKRKVRGVGKATQEMKSTQRKKRVAVLGQISIII